MAQWPELFYLIINSIIQQIVTQNLFLFSVFLLILQDIHTTYYDHIHPPLLSCLHVPTSLCIITSLLLVEDTILQQIPGFPVSYIPSL